MAKRRRAADPEHAKAEPGNLLSEWFGHRVFPEIADAPEALADQKSKRCPFLSAATGETRSCTKPASSSGVCTISSVSNGPRQDWLVCPYRALDAGLLDTSVRLLFDVESRVRVNTVSAAALARADIQGAVRASVMGSRERVFVYFQDKVGGEISVSATERSPELSFDITIVEIGRAGDVLAVDKYGILEVQTMDFHGSYRYAVKNLEDALRLHGSRLAQNVRRNREWLSDHIEGPNIANVFKRTFYQVMLKFQIGKHRHSTGCVLAIPASVWDSWQRHLGAPTLKPEGRGAFLLDQSRGGDGAAIARAWILVFDIAEPPLPTPSPIMLTKRIRTAPAALAYYAFEAAPAAALAQGAAADAVLGRVRDRLRALWPGLVLADDEKA